MLLAPLVRGRKGQHKDVLAADAQGGLRPRARRRRGVRPRPGAASWRRARITRIEAVVDRIVIREGRRSRGWPNRLDAGAVSTAKAPMLADATCEPDGNGRQPARPGHCGTSGSSARCTPARTARSASRSSSRARSASTAPTAPARPAKGWARACSSIPTGAARRQPVAGRRGDRALEGRHAGRAAQATERSLRAFAAVGRASTGRRRCRPAQAKAREQLLHGDGKRVSRRADAARTGIRHDAQAGRAANGSKPFAAR